MESQETGIFKYALWNFVVNKQNVCLHSEELTKTVKP